MRPLQPNKAESLTSVLEIAPIEFARQLSVYWKKIFDRIQPIEFISTKSDQKSALKSLIDEFNTSSNWVAHEIVSTANLKEKESSLSNTFYQL